jgi:hypothetical protein
MPLTFSEVEERLTKLDEITLIEVLEITSEEIVTHFRDKIEDNLENLVDDLEDSQLDLFNDRD